MKVLIIDDSKYIRALVLEMLEEMDISGEGAVDGLDGVEKIKGAQERFDIVLLDWNMPNLDGIGVLDALKDHSINAPPIVMMTTEDEPEKITLALEKGAVEYIIKPFTKDILEGKIRMVLGE